MSRLFYDVENCIRAHKRRRRARARQDMCGGVGVLNKGRERRVDRTMSVCVCVVVTVNQIFGAPKYRVGLARARNNICDRCCVPILVYSITPNKVNPLLETT